LLAAENALGLNPAFAKKWRAETEKTCWIAWLSLLKMKRLAHWSSFRQRPRSRMLWEFRARSSVVFLQRRNFALSDVKERENPGTPESYSSWEKRIGKGSTGLPDFVEMWTRSVFYKAGAAGSVLAGLLVLSWGPSVGSALVLGGVAGYWVLGIQDIQQSHHSVRRNFPVLGRMRYLLESIRPEIRQYFIEDDNEAKPFGREQRSIAYQRAKGMSDTMSFGTRRDVYVEGYEWVAHSIWPVSVPAEHQRTMIGNKECKQKFLACRLNVSGMSYGALSENAILALNTAAKMGNFYHNTGEGGISRFHNEPGGDLVWNIGTAYYGCRDKTTGGFDPVKFKDRASADNVKMIEIKLSQGAKPGHGGMLPGAKVTPAIAEARGLKVGEPSNSPPRHSAFSNHRELVEFISRLSDLSGGKPIGLKMCLGKPAEFAALVAAMIEMDYYPSFITLDGSEGGTGSAPQEFSNHIGYPLHDALAFVNNILIGAGVREHVKVICAGKILSGFSMVRAHCLGADVCNAARAMMFALGCIQSLKCQTNKCPTGITTLDPELMHGLDVTTKSYRVWNYHRKTVDSFLDIVGAMGVEDPDDLRPEHVMRRLAGGTYSLSYADVFPRLEPRSLIEGTAHNHPSNIQDFWLQGEQTLRGKRLKSIPFNSLKDPARDHRIT